MAGRYSPPGSGYAYGQQQPPVTVDRAGGSGAPSAPQNNYAPRPTTQPYASPPASNPYVPPPTSYPYASPPESNPYVPPPTSHPYSPPASNPYVPPPTSHSYATMQASNPYVPPPTNQPYASRPESNPYAPPPTSQPYASPPVSYLFGPPPTSQPYASLPVSHPYRPPPAIHLYSSPSQVAQSYGGYGAGLPAGSGYPPPPSYESFNPSQASVFPPGMDSIVVECFQAVDRDGNGFLDDKELQEALMSGNHCFGISTVHLLMYNFSGSNGDKIGRSKFADLFATLQIWRQVFDLYDHNQSGIMDANDLREALPSLGFSVSQSVLNLLISRFDNTAGRARAVEYGNFVECCLTIKGLTEKFREKDTPFMRSATFAYEEFMLTVLPFLVT